MTTSSLPQQVIAVHFLLFGRRKHELFQEKRGRRIEGKDRLRSDEGPREKEIPENGP